MSYTTYKIYRPPRNNESWERRILYNDEWNDLCNWFSVLNLFLAQLRLKSYGTSLTLPFLGSFTILGI